MPMDLHLLSSHEAEWNGQVFRCAIGRGGVEMPAEKTEGDGATPSGRWLMREVFFRADRLARPQTLLPCRPLGRADGWCDAAGDPRYNCFVTHPYPASAEELWRADGLYDLIVVLGYNDAPVVDGKGSAIFLHVARPDYGPSEGCVHLSRQDLLTVLRQAQEGSAVVIPPKESLL